MFWLQLLIQTHFLFHSTLILFIIFIVIIFLASLQLKEEKGLGSLSSLVAGLACGALSLTLFFHPFNQPTHFFGWLDGGRKRERAAQINQWMDNELIYGWVRCKRASGHNPLQANPTRHSLLSFAFGLSFRWFGAALSFNQLSICSFFHSQMELMKGKDSLIWGCLVVFFSFAERAVGPPPLIHSKRRPTTPNQSSHCAAAANETVHQWNGVVLSFLAERWAGPAPLIHSKKRTPFHFFTHSLPWGRQTHHKLKFIKSFILKEWFGMNLWFVNGGGHSFSSFIPTQIK